MKGVLVYITLLFLPLYLSAQEGQSSAGTDSVRHVTRQYKLNETYTALVDVPLDTLINTFHRYRRTEEISPFFQELGNYGLPYTEIDFFDRPFNPDVFIYRHLRHYMHHAGNKLYVDTQVPFTELKWTFGDDRKLAEQTLGVRHSQNVNPFFNIGLDLNIIYSLGEYMYQKSDNRAFTLHSSYLKEKYKAFVSWSINNLKAYENGGVADADVLDQYDTRDVPVNLGGLSEAQSNVKNMNLQLVQKYTVGGSANPSDSTGTKNNAGLSGTFTHILEFEKGHRLYTDNNPTSGFYDSVYIDNGTTYDSLYNRVLSNTLRFDFATGENARFQLGIGAGVLNELYAFGQIVPSTNMDGSADTLGWKRSSNALVGTLFNNIGDKFGWRADGKLYFTGMRAGDFEVKGSVEKTFNEGERRSKIIARGGVYNTGPAWWLNNWGSYHFIWSNNFAKQFRIEAGGTYSFPAVRLSAGIDYALISNMLYFNSEAQPASYDGAVSVISARLDKDFSFWKFRFDNSLLVQKTSHSDILDLPLLSARSAFYFNHEFYFAITDGHLQTELGFEAEYNTPWYSNAYMPSTGVFYNQGEITTGNYPVVNVFLNIKLKRTRIFLGFDHVNHGLMGYDYFASPYYPMPVRMFKYGLAWTFYN